MHHLNCFLYICKIFKEHMSIIKIFMVFVLALKLNLYKLKLHLFFFFLFKTYNIYFFKLLKNITLLYIFVNKSSLLDTYVCNLEVLWLTDLMVGSPGLDLCLARRKTRKESFYPSVNLYVKSLKFIALHF